MRLPSQVALVTGAASGIARAVAIRFAQEGAAVMVADADERGGMDTASEIRREGWPCSRAWTCPRRTR